MINAILDFVVSEGFAASLHVVTAFVGSLWLALYFWFLRRPEPTPHLWVLLPIAGSYLWVSFAGWSTQVFKFLPPTFTVGGKEYATAVTLFRPAFVGIYTGTLVLGALIVWATKEADAVLAAQLEEIEETADKVDDLRKKLEE